MRPATIVALTAGSILSLGAARPGSPWDPYLAELHRQCPAKHLEWLAPAELRDAIDNYKEQVDTRTRERMTMAERLRCKHIEAGATCGNVGDLDVVEQEHGLPALASSVCGSFMLCREQSDCDAPPRQISQAGSARTAWPA